MSEYFRLIVRFSHVFFISTCCQSNGSNPIQEDLERSRFSAPGADVQESAVSTAPEQEEEGSEEATEEDLQTIRF